MRVGVAVVLLVVLAGLAYAQAPTQAPPTPAPPSPTPTPTTSPTPTTNSTPPANNATSSSAPPTNTTPLPSPTPSANATNASAPPTNATIAPTPNATTPPTTSNGSPLVSTPPPNASALQDGPSGNAAAAVVAPQPPVAPPHLARWVAPAVGAGVIAAGAALSLARFPRARFRFLVLLAPLYARLRNSDVLDHETRAQIHSLIAASPGITYGVLLHETKLPRGVLLHHLRILERHQLVVHERDGHRSRWRASGAHIEPGFRPSGAQARVLTHLARGACTQGDMRRALGISQQGVSYHLKTLERAGLVEARAEAQRHATVYALKGGS